MAASFSSGVSNFASYVLIVKEEIGCDKLAKSGALTVQAELNVGNHVQMSSLGPFQVFLTDDSSLSTLRVFQDCQ